MVIRFNAALTAPRLRFGKQPAPPTGKPPGMPGGAPPTDPNGKRSKLSPEMRQVLNSLKEQLRRRSPNGQIQEKDALAAVTTLINLQKGRQFVETDYTRMVGGVMGPMNPFRNDPKWLAERAQFLQRQPQTQTPPNLGAYANSAYTQAYRGYPSAYGTTYATAYPSSYPSGYPNAWGQGYTTQAYYGGMPRYY